MFLTKTWSKIIILEQFYQVETTGSSSVTVQILCEPNTNKQGMEEDFWYSTIIWKEDGAQRSASQGITKQEK